MNSPRPTDAALQAELQQIQQLLPVNAALAEEKAAALLATAPGHPHAALLRGVARRFGGNPAGAVEVLRPLAQARPEWASAHYELGRALAASGDVAGAQLALEQAFALQPNHPGVWNSLADLLRANGDEAGADAVCAKRIQAASLEPRLQHADTARRAERLDEANKLLQIQLDQDPTDIVAMQMLAALALRLGHLSDAATLLARCVELAPNFAAARYDYALVLYRQMRRADALVQIEKAVAVDPQNPTYRYFHAVLLESTGDYEQAIAIRNELLQLKPDDVQLNLIHGHGLRTVGRHDECIELYKKCIAWQPTLGEAWWCLADLKTYRFSDEETAQLRANLARDDVDDNDRMLMEFALGKALEDDREYEQAFAHYSEGNRMHSVANPYDPAQMTELVADSKAVFTREFFAAREGAGCPAKDPIFVVGLPRAGSTLIEQILASHPEVEGTQELPDMLVIVRDLTERSAAEGGKLHADLLPKLSHAELTELGERYLAMTDIYRKTERPFFIDKMPNNFANVGLIHLLLPNARIIDARRHPLACGYSNFRQYYHRGQIATYGLTDLGLYYRDYVELMAHYDAVLPGRVHRVLHEQLVDDTEAEIRSLLDYCGLPFDERCLNFHQTKRAIRTASSAQARQPIQRGGLEHWRHFEPWLEPMKAALGPVLSHYPDPPWSGPMVDGR